MNDSIPADQGLDLLLHGDNLDILRERVEDRSVDLVYLDPPFKSDRDYGRAFKDTWSWNEQAEETLGMLPKGSASTRILKVLASTLGRCTLVSYLLYMVPRLIEIHRSLKDTGSVYLHCDSSANHYLKVFMDAIFGHKRMLNEITWKRTSSHGNTSRNFGSICDRILVYTKTNEFTWNQQYIPYTQEYIETAFKYRDEGGRKWKAENLNGPSDRLNPKSTNKDEDGRRWQSCDLTNPTAYPNPKSTNKDEDGKRWKPCDLRNPSDRPNLKYPYTASNGITYYPHPNGWRWTLERMKKCDEENRLCFPKKPNGRLRYKLYLDESPGVKIQNLWNDIPHISAGASERLGYPTQKPEALLERIIRTSSNEGDTVLDPFCGSGTTLAVSKRLERHWIGIDLNEDACKISQDRLDNMRIQKEFKWD